MLLWVSVVVGLPDKRGRSVSSQVRQAAGGRAVVVHPASAPPSATANTGAPSAPRTRPPHPPETTEDYCCCCTSRRSPEPINFRFWKIVTVVLFCRSPPCRPAGIRRQRGVEFPGLGVIMASSAAS